MEQNFIPWLMDEMEENLRQNEMSRLLLDTLIREVTNFRLDDYKKLEELLATQQPSAETNTTTDELSNTLNADIPAVVNRFFVIFVLLNLKNNC